MKAEVTVLIDGKHAPVKSARIVHEKDGSLRIELETADGAPAPADEASERLKQALRDVFDERPEHQCPAPAPVFVPVSQPYVALPLCRVCGLPNCRTMHISYTTTTSDVSVTGRTVGAWRDGGN